MRLLTAMLLSTFISTSSCQPVKYLDRSFYSDAFQTERWYRIYLPKSYDQNRDQHYPVIYYFHGWGGRYKWDSYDVEDDINYPENGRKEPPFIMEWHEYTQRNEVIIVTWDGYEPNLHPGRKSREGLAYGSSRPYDCVMAHETEDHHWGWDYRLYFQDLVGHIDATYRTLPDRSQRGVTGLSMGGQASLFISGQNKDLVGSVSAFDPADNYAKYGPKGFQVPMPNLELYRSLRGIPLRLTMTDGDWLKYNDWKLKEICHAAYPDRFDFHMADYPNHWAADINKQLDFHLNCFHSNLSPPRSWNHISPAFPSFSVFDHHFSVTRSIPAHTIVERYDKHKMMVLSRPFIPDGPIVQEESIQLTIDRQFDSHEKFDLVLYNLSSGKLTSREVQASTDGTAKFSVGGGGHLIGLNEGTDQTSPNLCVVVQGNPRYHYFERNQSYPIDFRVINLSNRKTNNISIRPFSLDPEVHFSILDTSSFNLNREEVLDLKNQFSITIQNGSNKNYCSAFYLEININDISVDTVQRIFHPVTVSPYIAQKELLILDGREVSEVPIYEQGPNEIVFNSLSGGSGNGNGVFEPGETVLIYVRLEKGMAPNDQQTYHRSYLINAMDDKYLDINALDYEEKTNQAGATSVATLISMHDSCPENHSLDLWLKVESLYNDQDDPTSNATIYAHQYDYRRVKLSARSVQKNKPDR